MFRETTKVFFVVALGAGIGSFVALEVNPWFWWVGLLVGGLVGYLSYEWRKVLSVIPVAYNAARGWKPPQYYWATIWWAGLLSSTVAFWIVLVFVICVAHGSIREFSIKMLWGVLFSIFVGIIPAIISALDTETPERASEFIGDLKRCFYFIAPPIVIFWHLPRGIIRLMRGIVWLICHLPVVVIAVISTSRCFGNFLKRFIWELFLRIHSEMRLLCGVDAMLGSAIGYYAGSVIVGAIAGGFLGVINYLLVTEHWLKQRGYLPVRS